MLWILGEIIGYVQVLFVLTDIHFKDFDLLFRPTNLPLDLDGFLDVTLLAC